MTIHTMPVPNGCTIEFAWMLHCAGVKMDASYGEGWVNLEIDDDTHEIVQVYTDEDEREARKRVWAGWDIAHLADDTHVEHDSNGAG
jgi:hypothetical protein